MIVFSFKSFFFCWMSENWVVFRRQTNRNRHMAVRQKRELGFCTKTKKQQDSNKLIKWNILFFSDSFFLCYTLRNNSDMLDALTVHVHKCCTLKQRIVVFFIFRKEIPWRAQPFQRHFWSLLQHWNSLLLSSHPSDKWADVKFCKKRPVSRMRQCYIFSKI